MAGRSVHLTTPLPGQCSGHDYSKAVTPKSYTTLHNPKIYPHTKFGIPISSNIRYMLRHPKMVCNTPSSQDAYTYQIWNSYLKEYKTYAPDAIILKTRSEIKVKVTVTRKWYVTLRHPKMHLHNKFGIPISKNKGDLHQTHCSF